MLLVGFRGLTVDDDSPIGRDIRERQIGGVVLFDYDMALRSAQRNIASPTQLTQLICDLQARAAIPLFVAIDQEGGRVNRLKAQYGFPPTVSAAQLGALNQLEATRQAAAQTADTLAALGVNLNFAPVVDLNVNPASPAIGKVGRSFSADPDVVVAHAAAWIQAHRARHILCALKHFPGHGSAQDDSHDGFVDLTRTWHTAELLPFQRLLAAGLGDVVMTAHVFHAVLDPMWPATLSKAILTDLLRGQLGFDGVVISDDLQMNAIRARYDLETAVVTAINAGVDVLLLGNTLAYDETSPQRVSKMITDAVARGVIARAQITRAYQRICALKAKWSATTTGAEEAGIQR